MHTLKRQLEAYESKHIDEMVAAAPVSTSARQRSPARGGSAPVSLQHSRTNSNSSLDKPEGWVVVEPHHHGSPEPNRLAPTVPDMVIVLS